MKKKQILFLFAASALFAACSSDEMPGDNNQAGGDDNSQIVVEDLPSSVAVSTENGFGMTVGASSGTKAATRANEENDYFTLTLPEGIFGEWEGYIAEADDFYITKTVNGNKEVVMVTNEEGVNSSSYGKIKVTRGDDLVVTVDNINATNMFGIEQPIEYTFEVYIWIKNQIEKTYSGADGVFDITVDNFSYTQKLEWIGLTEDATVTKDTERGMDFTDQVTEYELVKNATGKIITDEFYGKNFHYNIRFNVYRGLQGNPTLADGVTVNEEQGLGNTPYIKVSIHTARIKNPADPDGEEVFPVLPKD